jgi:hypothetical protein
MKIKYFFIYVSIFFLAFNTNAQKKTNYPIFINEPVNYNGVTGHDSEVVRLQSGRIVLKKVTVPEYTDGTDVKIKITLRSNGDRWDKSGSCFVVTNPNQISIIDVSKKEEVFPKGTYINEKYGGVLATENYKPVLELMRFMTPFGVGHFSTNKDAHRRPVYIPNWEKQVVWQQDISALSSEVTGTFYIGVWIDSWTEEGYQIDVSLKYSNRPLKKVKVMPLVNTISYVDGQSLPDFFAETTLKHDLTFERNIKNVKLHYITTGHGGHSGGDEFVKIKNSLYVDNNLVLDTIPWRDDCASFRRFNPTSGVWLKKDSASYIDFEAKAYKIKEIEERIASSDLSRSNWCPGSSLVPIVVELGDLNAGKHTFQIEIPATKAEEDKLNHWLVSAYITYEE